MEQREGKAELEPNQGGGDMVEGRVSGDREAQKSSGMASKRQRGWKEGKVRRKEKVNRKMEGRRMKVRGLGMSLRIG